MWTINWASRRTHAINTTRSTRSTRGNNWTNRPRTAQQSSREESTHADATSSHQSIEVKQYRTGQTNWEGRLAATVQQSYEKRGEKVELLTIFISSPSLMY
jgi:hypothetical protein